jgi:monodehydroascorbate reductase (NADH)
MILSAAPARLPSFHTCVGANDEKLTPKWYKDHGNYICTFDLEKLLFYLVVCLRDSFLIILLSGIELVLGTRVKSVDVRRKTLLSSTGETISYKFLIIATGARVWLAQ